MSEGSPGTDWPLLPLEPLVADYREAGRWLREYVLTGRRPSWEPYKSPK